MSTINNLALQPLIEGQTEATRDHLGSIHPKITSPAYSVKEPATSDLINSQGTIVNGSKTIGWVHIEVIQGGQSNSKVPVAITGRYEGLDLAGPTKAFDCQLDSWISRAVDMGMIGSALGQVHVFNLDKHSTSQAATKVNVERLVLMGMGVIGQFSADDARYLMSNATVAVKCMGYDTCSAILFGIRREEMTVEQAVRAFLLGIRDGYERCHAIAESVKDNRLHFQNIAKQKLKISLIESDPERVKKIFHELKNVKKHAIPGLILEVDGIQSLPEDVLPKASAADIDPYVPVTYMRVTRATESVVEGEGINFQISKTKSDVYQFSALSDAAAMTVREVEVNSYFANQMLERLATENSPGDQEDLSLFLTNYLIPDDFQSVIENAKNLTFVVDKSTAQIPWEMAAFKGNCETNVRAKSVPVSRRFHTLMSPSPGALPPLNKSIKFLVIADPASGRLELPAARNEAFAIIDILEKAQKLLGEPFKIKVTLRVGSRKFEDRLKNKLDKYRESKVIETFRSCDPLEIVRRIVNEQYDIIHYAGHGGFVEKTNRAGWLLDEDCFLTAQEIFRVRQVPRLVFSNACYSAVTPSVDNPGHQVVGLAQAFFARGIPNYIGTGWRVDDESACEFARWFYATLLGLRDISDAGIDPESPPATIGQAMLRARQEVSKLDPESSTWGAYQHYGRISDKVLPFLNANLVAN